MPRNSAANPGPNGTNSIMSPLHSGLFDRTYREASLMFCVAAALEFVSKSASVIGAPTMK